MSNIQVSKDVLFLDSDLTRPRWTVEQEKIRKKFPGFRLHSKDGTSITSVEGVLHTSYGNSYYVKISIPENYPYQIPSVLLPHHSIESHCPHRFSNETICLMKAEQWSSAYSIAFVISKTALWLNKYDYWKRNGSWPGKAQAH